MGPVAHNETWDLWTDTDGTCGTHAMADNETCVQGMCADVCARHVGRHDSRVGRVGYRDTMNRAA